MTTITSPGMVGIIRSHSVINVKNSADNNVVGDDNNAYEYAYVVLKMSIQALQMLAVGYYADYKKKSDAARDTQAKANEVDEVIADAAKDKDPDKAKRALPDDVVAYMRDHGITVDGVDIQTYLNSHGDKAGKLDKGELQAVKAALDNSANRDMDLLNQGQLEIQKIVQQLTTIMNQASTVLSQWNQAMSTIVRNTGG